MLLDTIDFHLHTNRSDGELDLKRTVEEYAKRGYTHLGITDHYFESRGIDHFFSAREEIDKGNWPLKIYLSCEIELADDKGEIDCPKLDEIKEVLDYISVAPHCKSVLPKIPCEDDPIDYCHRMLLEAARNPEVRVILHPWDAPRSMIERLDELPDGYLREFAEVAAQTNTIVEVSNCFSHFWVWRSMGLADTYHLLVKELLRAGAKIVIGSDGHAITPGSTEKFPYIPATLCDTKWAADLVKQEGGTDEDVELPVER